MGLNKRIIAKNIISKLKTILTLIKNNEIINFSYNTLIYFFLLFLFLYLSRVLIWFKIFSGNLSYLNIFTVLFAFLLNLVLVAKIISVRSKWKTLFFKSNDILSWKTILRKEPISVFIITFWNSSLVSIMAFQILDAFSNFEYNNQLLIRIAIITLFTTIILFEISFLGLLFIYKEKKTKCDNVNKPIDDPIKFQFTNSKVVLFLILIASITFARFVSEQVNDVLLGSIALDLGLFFVFVVITSILYIYFMLSLNVIIFKYLNLDYKIDNKGNTGIFLIIIFLFINGVYFAKYVATAIVYLPSEIPDPLFNEMLQQLCMLSGGISYYDPIIINIMIFFFFLIISVIFAIVIYIIFLYYTFKKHSPEFKLYPDQTAVGHVHEPLGYRGQKIIRKLFSKFLKNYNFGKCISYFYYMFWFCTPLILSLVVTYFVVSDSMFDKNTFIIFVLKYQYIVGAYCIFGLVLSGIFEEFQKLHEYQVTDFISKKILYEYIKYSFVYTSIITSCLITFYIKNIYQISEKYHNLFAPECIQVVHSIFFLYTSGYILLILSKKTEEIFIKAIERETA